MGMPAARLTDFHMCPMMTPAVPPIPHVGGPIISAGVPTVLIGGMPAATISDMCMCTASPPDIILPNGCMVLIGGKPAARLGDMTAHGGTIMLGCMTVLIGMAGSSGGGGGGGEAGGAGGVSAGANAMKKIDNTNSLAKAAISGDELAERKDEKDYTAQFTLLDEAEKPVKDIKYEIETPDGQTHKGKTDSSGKTDPISGFTIHDCRCTFLTQ